MTVAGLGHLHSIIVNPLGMLAPMSIGVLEFKRVGIGLELWAVLATAPGIARVARQRYNNQ